MLDCYTTTPPRHNNAARPQKRTTVAYPIALHPDQVNSEWATVRPIVTLAPTLHCHTAARWDAIAPC